MCMCVCIHQKLYESANQWKVLQCLLNTIQRAEEFQFFFQIALFLTISLRALSRC